MSGLFKLGFIPGLRKSASRLHGEVKRRPDGLCTGCPAAGGFAILQLGAQFGDQPGDRVCIDFNGIQSGQKVFEFYV